MPIQTQEDVKRDQTFVEIKEGVNNASLEKCDIANLHCSFCTDSPSSLEGNGVFANRIQNGVLRVFSQEGFRGTTDFFPRNNTDNVFCRQDRRPLTYNDTTPLAHFTILNPFKPGANGIEIKGMGFNNIMLTSGKLSGCSFAVLFNACRLFVIHAGADINGEGNNGSEYKYADLFCMANYLLTNVENQIDRLSFYNLIAELEKLGFHGYIFYSSHMKSLSIGDYKQIVARSYTTECDVVCVINKNCLMEIAMREFSYGHILDIKKGIIFQEQIR